MKKILLSLCVFVPMLSLAQVPMAYTVKGKIGKLNAPAKIYLVDGHSVLDSAALKNGAFEMKGTTDYPKEMEILLHPNGRVKDALANREGRLGIFLEPDPVVVTSAGSLSEATVKGGKLQADQLKLKASLKPVIDKMNAQGAFIQKATEAERNAPAFKERIRTQGEANHQEYIELTEAFIKANPNSWVSLYTLWQLKMISPPTYAAVAPLYEPMSPALKNSPPGRLYGEMLQGLRNVAIGAQAPKFSQKTPDAKVVSLADYRGKYVLLEFWASWCGPCRQENPALIKIYNAYKDRNFDVLGVSLDDEKSREKWLKAIKDDQLPWTQVSDLKGWQNEVAKLYGVQGVPQNFLVDPTGKIIASNLRGVELEQAMARFVK